MDFKNDKWVFIENLDINLEILNIGLETFDKIKHQLDIDIPRLNITVNKNKINCKEDILENNLDMLRCCTQSVFYVPLEYFIKLFSDFHITHKKKKNKSLISINTNKKYKFSLLSYLNLSESYIISENIECVISTYFNKFKKKDMKYCFSIYMQFTFDLKSNKGVLIYQIKK
jgi:hypothetical protein